MVRNVDQIRPMLAAKFSEDIALRHIEEDGYLFVQPKIDGMRVLVSNGEARSRSWKLWTNTAMQKWAWESSVLMEGWDGEMLPGIMSGDVDGEMNPTIFREAQSGLRAADGSKEFTYFLFDNFAPETMDYNYRARLTQLQKHFPAKGSPSMMFEGLAYKVRVVVCPTHTVSTLDQLYAMEEDYLAKGFEGLIIRRWKSGYKYNRATQREGWLTKLKRFDDAEAEIIGFEPRYHNENEATVSELGYTARSSHQENLVAEDCLGALLLRLPSGVEFSLGVFKGLTYEQKVALWAQRDQLIGKHVTFKHQGFGGGYDKPRTPVFHGFRDSVEL